MRLLRQTGLSELEQVQQLTNGLPKHWQLNVISAGPRTPTQWVPIAQQIESHFNTSNSQRERNKVQTSQRTINQNSTSQRNSTSRTFTANSTAPRYDPNAPPPQCRFCQNLGITANHWHRVCENKPNNPNAQRNTSNRNNRVNNSNQRNQRDNANPQTSTSNEPRRENSQALVVDAQSDSESGNE